jgi:hypothetical protein
LPESTGTFKQFNDYALPEFRQSKVDGSIPDRENTMRQADRPKSFEFPVAQAIPGPENVQLRWKNQEMATYEFGLNLPKPFVHPLRGPSDAVLTRYGHPNPQSNHDHHRSIWFGHQFIRPLDAQPTGKTATPPQEWNFWEEPKPTSDVKIRHSRVLALEDGPNFAATAVEAIWWAGGRQLLRQTTIYAISRIDDKHQALDVQAEFTVINGLMIELGKSNFGLMGVRVAKTISEQFGGGRLLNSESAVGEPAIFGKTARWVDYSGPTGPDLQEGICYMDHPSNPRHPSHWHVRRDGWMIASITLSDSWRIAADHPLKLRYRLLAHSLEGRNDRERLDHQWSQFAQTKGYELQLPKGGVPRVIRLES